MILRLVIIGYVAYSAFGAREEWEKDGRYSRYKVSGGQEDRTVYYVCKAKSRGSSDYMCGKMHSTGSGCAVTWFDRVSTATDFEVLIAPPDAEYKFEWLTESYQRGAIPTNAVNCSDDTYVGRKRDGGNWYLGKVDTKHNLFFYGKGEDEKQTDTYNVLVKVPRQV